MSGSRTAAPASLFAVLLLAGCAHNYVTPGGGVSLAAIDDATIEAAFSRHAASPFPARIAVARVQAVNYSTRTNHGHPVGGYSIVTTRDVESDQAFDELTELPLIGGVAPLNRLLLPGFAVGVLDLRRPAALLKADMLLIYSIDTAFTVDGRSLGPLSTISLGLLRNKTAHVTATVSGILVDVRTGFIYGVTEASATEQQKASIWSQGMVIDTARLAAEKAAFDGFVGEFERLWTGVLDSHAARQAVEPQPASVSAGSSGGWCLVPGGNGATPERCVRQRSQ